MGGSASGDASWCQWLSVPVVVLVGRSASGDGSWCQCQW